MKKYDLVCIGSITVDMQLAAQDADLAAHNLPKGFSTLVTAAEAKEIAGELKCSRNPGGPGTNVAAGVALRGGAVALTGKIANDDHGTFITQRMADHGVAFTPLLSDNPATGTTVILALTTPDRERSFASAPGASMEMRPEDIDTKLIAQGKITYFDSYLWLSETGRETVAFAADAAKQSGSLVALALNDAGLVARHQPAYLALALSHADILVGDKREFMALFATSTLEETIAKVQSLGVTASITAGAAGAYVIDAAGMTHVPAKLLDKAKIVDTNGAGDQFAAGFLYGLAQGKTAAEAGAMGAEWASDIIQHFGAEPKVGRNAPAIRTGTIQNKPDAPKKAA